MLIGQPEMDFPQHLQVRRLLDSAEPPISKKSRLFRKRLSVVARKQAILGDKYSAPATGGGSEDISVQRIPAHRDAVRCQGWQRCLDQVVDFGERLSEELDMVWEQVGNLMAEMPGLNRKSVVAGGGQIRVSDEHIPRAVLHGFHKQTLPRHRPVRRGQKQELVDSVVIVGAVFQARYVVGQVGQRIGVSRDDAPMPRAQMLKCCFAAGDDFFVIYTQAEALELCDCTAAVVAGGIGEDANVTAPFTQLIQPSVRTGIIVSPTLSTPNASKTKAST